jgi:hypothetical protein
MGSALKIKDRTFVILRKAGHASAAQFSYHAVAQTPGQPCAGLSLDQHRVGRSLLLRPSRVRHASNGYGGWVRKTGHNEGALKPPVR